jgi:hypothetical protein
MADKPSSLQDGVITALDNLVKKHYFKYGVKRVGSDIAAAVWRADCFNGIVRNHLIILVKKYMKAEIFSPHKIVRAMDLFGGMLSFQAIRVLRWIEGDGSAYNHALMIPSVGVLQRYMANFTAFCSNQVKCKFFQTDSGEGFEYDERQIISIIWKGTNKDTIARDSPTSIVLTTDGVKITRNLNLVIMGIKEIEAKLMPLLASHLLKRGNNEDDDGFGMLDHQSAF